ncbi:MAG: transposase [Desulfobacterales bacterium]|nr:transposase [Desulfobacterales bacterium]
MNTNWTTLPRRKSIRLKGYDYSRAGTYFITICTQNRSCLFGQIENGKMILNEYGKIIKTTWEWLQQQYEYIDPDEFVVMPNHLHGIIVLRSRGGSPYGRFANRPYNATGKHKPLGRLIGAFKTVSTKQINKIRQTPGAKLWQRNYYEHIIRNDKSYHQIAEYIQTNPLKWLDDRYYA